MLRATFGLLAGAAGLAIVSVASAAPVAFENSFDTTGFTHQSANWTRADGKLTNTASGSATVVSTATSQFTGMGSGDYTVATQFTIVDGVATLQSNTNAGIGIALFGGNSNLDNTTAKFLLADVSAFVNGEPANASAGTLRIFEVGSTSTLRGSANTGVGPLTQGTQYTLKATATEVSGAPGTFNISVALFDGTGTTQLGAAATTVTPYTPVAEPIGGYYAGLRTRYPFASGPVQDATTAFDSFSIGAVPEPGSLMLVGLMGLPLLRRRRA